VASSSVRSSSEKQKTSTVGLKILSRKRKTCSHRATILNRRRSKASFDCSSVLAKIMSNDPLDFETAQKRDTHVRGNSVFLEVHE
jgi:hypothetical protein